MAVNLPVSRPCRRSSRSWTTARSWPQTALEQVSQRIRTSDPEAIHFDVAEVARAFCSASQLRWAFSGTDPIGPMSELRFHQTTFDGHAYFILKTRPTQTKYLRCDTRARTGCPFRVRPDH